MRLAFLALALGLAGCTYTSFYSQSSPSRPPIAPHAVKVVRTRADLVTPWSELGHYRGSAPSVAQAIDGAKQKCAQSGAEFFILNTEPYQSGRKFRVDGICAANEAPPRRTGA